MKRRRKIHKLIEQDAPPWAEASAPRNVLSRIAPALLIIDLGDRESQWHVATAGEANAVADPHSEIGKLLMTHCALMSLPYLSGN